MSDYTDELNLSPELAAVIDRDFESMERIIDNLRHEVVTLEEALHAADFRNIDYSQRIMAVAAAMDELGVHGDIRVHLDAALKLGDT
jgi:alkylhydroperoxidase/carboxymuconolactone decarboxylase family protein YurZ